MEGLSYALVANSGKRFCDLGIHEHAIEDFMSVDGEVVFSGIWAPTSPRAPRRPRQDFRGRASLFVVATILRPSRSRKRSTRPAQGARTGATASFDVRREGPYILSGADTPTRVSVRASTRRTASQAARRACESDASTGRPSLGNTWHTV